jgi:hypothetical protein
MMLHNCKKLLELAAKSVGREGIYYEIRTEPFVLVGYGIGPLAVDANTNELWNPLENYEQAMQLAIDLRLSIIFFERQFVSLQVYSAEMCVLRRKRCRDSESIHSELRRAIVEVAAAIGEAKNAAVATAK